jgi:ribosomal protein S18 acetylase RimI-like enzyme
MNIQLAKYKDARKISRLLFNALSVAGEEVSWTSRIERIKSHIAYKECYVIKNKGRLIGVMCLELLDDLEIESLGISRQFRNIGLGRKFIEKSFELAKLYGYNKVLLGSCSKFDAKDFYIKMGFKVVGKYSDGYEFEYRIKRSKK